MTVRELVIKLSEVDFNSDIIFRNDNRMLSCGCEGDLYEFKNIKENRLEKAVCINLVNY